MDLELGQQIDRYVVESVLGEGACGMVYRVRHARLGSQHALKVLLHTPRSMQIRLAQEGQIQAGLRHPNIVPVTDIIDVSGTPGLIAEYIDGEDLDAWWTRTRPDPARCDQIFRQILAGLAHAHSRGIIHRDIKPTNILVADVDGEPVPRITDFGIAKVLSEDSPALTRSRASMGSPRYMAPEQWRNSRDVDVRADVFSMGCILYELLCGRPAFGADNLPDIFQAAAAEDYTDPASIRDDLSPALLATIRGCLRAVPEERLADCAAVLRSLDGAPPLAPPLPTAETPPTLLPAVEHQAAETLAPLDADDSETVLSDAASTQDLLRATRRPRWPVLAAAIAGLGLLGLLRLSGPSEPVEAPAEAPAEVPEASPTEVSPEAEVPEEPVPEEPEVPEVPLLEEPAAPRPARVHATGSAESVWLLQGGRRVALGEVPPGRYIIQAIFAGSTVQAGEVSLRAGERVTLKCDDIFQQCRREGL